MNQNRINKKNEHTYLVGLKEEFLISKINLEELIAVNQRNYNGVRRILEYTNPKNELPTGIKFSELLNNTFSFDVAFNPNNSLLIEIISSGNLKNISNPELRIQYRMNRDLRMCDSAKNETRIERGRHKRTLYVLF